jgi:hypothetical protein
MPKPRYKANQKVKGGVAKRTARRLAAVRLENPGALKGVSAKGGYTGREARKTKRAANALPKPKPRKPTAAPFDPLKPVTGKTFESELKAKERLEFSDVDREQRQAEANQAQTQANTGTYWDDYRQALREAKANVAERGRQAVDEQNQRVDTAYAEDRNAVAQRDQAATEAAAKLGRGPVQSVEGGQAVEAARSQGNQNAARTQRKMNSDTDLFEKKEATSLLGKAQELAKENARARRLGEDAKQIAQKKGDFRVGQRDQTRKSEREWAAIQKEFKLEKRGQDIDAKNTRADRKLEQQKVNAQKIVARIYANADKAGARAQIRVAELQLKKGKITKNQMKTIRNIYEGLPGGGTAANPNAGTKGPKSGAGQWGGPVDTPVERQKADQMFADLRSRKPPASARSKIINGAVRNGVPRAAAVKAWRKYAAKFLPSTRPQTGTPVG